MELEVKTITFPIHLVDGEVYKNSVGILRVFNNYLPTGFEAVASIKAKYGLYNREVFIKAYFDEEDIEEAEFYGRDLRDVVLTRLYHNLLEVR